MKKRNLIPIKWNDVTLEQAVTEQITVWKFDRERPYKLTKGERAQFEQAKEQGYIVYGSRPNLRQAFSTWCEIHERPYIYIEKHGRYAKVEMDLTFNKTRELNELNQELIREMYYAVSTPQSEWYTGHIYNSLDHITLDSAEFVAQFFVVIERRNMGEDNVQIPPYPNPHPGNLFLPRWEETKQLYYARTHTVRDPLEYRWESFCKVYRFPFIHLHEARKGHATLTVKLPEGHSWASKMQQIRLAAQEANLVDIKEVHHLRNIRWYVTDGTTGLSINRAAPTEDITYFAQALVSILKQDGYFENC